jgi:pyruvate formate lyase activating enzyme
MALVAPEDVYAYDLPPEAVVKQARATKARSVSYVFTEPVVFYEYMEAIATLAKRAKLLNLVHTNGFIAPKPLKALCGRLDAVSVDLKGFDPRFYRDLCEGELTPVLETLKQLKAADLHIEITNLVIPTLNDDMARIREMCRWIKRELGPGVPLHFARFYPLYKLANLPPTPVSALDRARKVALETGLHYVYVARVSGHEGENTFCPGCRKAVIRRMGFMIVETHLKSGKCGHCGAPIPGRWS